VLVGTADLRSDSAVVERTRRTLEIMHRWGYAPTLSVLARDLLGGGEDPSLVKDAIDAVSDIIRDGSFVFLLGSEHLVAKSGVRVASNKDLNGQAWAIAREYASDLVSVCPFVECLAISGSVASGGYDCSDDIDFDLFVKSGTKYTTYLLATLVGLRYSLRYRHHELEPVHRTPLLPKIICLNVVWTEDQTHPFVRRDADLAFELLRCSPVYGTRKFREGCNANPWATEYFPQLLAAHQVPEIPELCTPFRRVLSAVAGHRIVLRVLEAASRAAVWSLYHVVQWSRRANPEAVARNAFLRRVKWPYEVLQD